MGHNTGIGIGIGQFPQSKIEPCLDKQFNKL